MYRPHLKLKALISVSGLMGLVLLAGLSLSLYLGFVVSSAHAADGPARLVLKSQTMDADGDGKVSLSEVFDNAGNSGAVTIAEGRGATLVLDAARVQLLAQSLGLYWDNPRGLRRIIVTMGNTAPQLQTGFVATPLPAQAQMPAAAPVNPVPQATTANPYVIKRGDLVSVIWRSDGISLRTTAVAIRDGRVGDRADLQNPTSKKMIEAIITGPGRAEAGPLAQVPAPALAIR
jgi:flagellar basal body P-ring formation protein FlgA